MLEEFQAKVNGTESYNYLKTKPYRNCLAEMLSYNECDSKQECSVLLKYYASDDVGSEDHGKCKSFYDAYTSCMSNEANMPSDVEGLCTSKLSCPKADQELTVDELVHCAQEDENLKDANCRTAKSTYFKCLTANGASVCTSLEANACADEKAAEASACNP